MRLRAYDTVHVSAARAENIRPGEEFEISDAAGEELLKAHPGLFARVSAGAAEKAEPVLPENKAEPAPENKTAAAPIAVPERRSIPRR